MNISDLSLDDLLRGTEDRAAETVNTVDKWVQVQGIYPGTTRVMASDLYNRYVAYMKAQDPQGAGIVSISRWGVAMNLRFKRGKNAYGRFYYVSQETAQEIVEKLGG